MSTHFGDSFDYVFTLFAALTSSAYVPLTTNCNIMGLKVFSLVPSTMNQSFLDLNVKATLRF